MFGEPSLVFMQSTAALQQKKHKTDLKTTAKSWKPSVDEVFQDNLQNSVFKMRKAKNLENQFALNFFQTLC